jgi:hypothetical protein
MQQHNYLPYRPLQKCNARVEGALALHPHRGNGILWPPRLALNVYPYDARVAPSTSRFLLKAPAIQRAVKVRCLWRVFSAIRHSPHSMLIRILLYYNAPRNDEPAIRIVTSTCFPFNDLIPRGGEEWRKRG